MTKQYVILNEVKNPLRADKRQRTQRIASEEILRVAQDDKQYVILNEVKNLKVCETVESSTNLEILRFTQDDRVCERDYRVGHALLAMTEQQKKSADRLGRHSRLLNRTITTC